MNLYVHFPFCAAKCAYCALHSRAGAGIEERARYVREVAREIRGLEAGGGEHTVYFGGGSPGSCDLREAAEAVRERLGAVAEFTVELHPGDVTGRLLEDLAERGVNRISLGVQSFSDRALGEMRRRHDAAGAEAAFRAVKAAGFANAGMDLIAGWRGVGAAEWRDTVERAIALEPAHVSVYSLIREEGTVLDAQIRAGKAPEPDEEAGLEQVREAEAMLAAAGLERYEVSNYARRGMECRHNSAVWAGEDYVGLGEGASGRRGRVRTTGERGGGYREEEVAGEEADALERVVFRLRTRAGLDLERAAAEHPCLAERLKASAGRLDALAAAGVLERGPRGEYRPTSRGWEVADAVMAEFLGC